jgi:alkylresorcinol/alkylpyrone synthase
VATALPPHQLPQSELRAVAEAVLAGNPAQADVLDVFDHGRIDSRALAMPIPWYLEPHGCADRNQAFAEVGLSLVEQAARGAVANAGIRDADVDAIVLVCTTGIATPSLDARLCNVMDLRPDVLRLPVWGLGCAGGTGGLNRAADLARARLASRVLLVALELCSLSFDVAKALGTAPAPGDGPHQPPDKKSIVAASLFADGAAACIVAGDEAPPGPLQHIAGRSHLFPDTERVMGWDVLDHNLEVVLSPRIPEIIRQHMAGLAAPFVEECLGKLGRPDEWVLHPGGARVIDAYAEALGLAPADLRWTEGALRQHGNMSSPTVLFALKDAMDHGRPRPGQTALLAALGPGFASEMALVRA